MIYNPVKSSPLSSVFSSTAELSNLGGSRFVRLFNMSATVKEELLNYEKTKLLVRLNDTFPVVPVNAVIVKKAVLP